MIRIAFCFVVITFAVFVHAEPCHFIKNEFYEYTDVMNCFHSILLTDDVKYTTLETLKRSLEVYTFYDIARDSPDPNLPLKVDMRKGLASIKERPYVYDVDFQDDLRYLYLQLNDAHTQYYPPTCYNSFLIRQAFAPVGVGNSIDGFDIKISPYFSDDLLDWYEDNMNIHLLDYTNYTISSINGIPAFDYFMNYSENSVGISKDPGARFNYAMTLPEPRDDISVIMYGYWQQRSSRNPFPETESVLYELISPSGQTITLSLPWTFKAMKTYKGVDSWKNDYFSFSGDSEFNLLSEPEDNPAVTPLIMRVENSYNHQRIATLKEKLAKSQYGSFTQEMGFELLVNTTHLTFWQLSDNKTLVMYLDSMAPGKLSGYYPGLVKGFKIAAERGLSRLIIDLSNNGGGNICLGRSLIAFLQKDGWEGQGQNWGPEDIPLSPLAEQLIHSAVDNDIDNTIWSPAFYDNQQNEKIDNNDTSYLLPGVPHVRGGLLRRYSKLVHIDGCGDPGYVLDPAIDFSPNETIIVTNGFCGSTCALFSNHLSLYDNVKTVVLGGIPGKAMQYSAFPGGQVLDNVPLFSQLKRLKQNISYVPYEEMDPSDVVPRVLGTQAAFRYNIREIYPLPLPGFPYGTSPMEFTFQESTHHLYHNELTAVYPQYAWYEVLDFFDN